MAKQLNVFVENRPGRIESVASILNENEICIRTFTIQDRGDYGMMKMIVDNPSKAHLALADQGFACGLKDIVAVSIPDEKGNLFTLTSLLAEHNINIVDVYGFVSDADATGYCYMEIKEFTPDLKILLESKGFKVLGDEELYGI